MPELELTFEVNGRPVSLRVDPGLRLLDVLREDLQLRVRQEITAWH